VLVQSGPIQLSLPDDPDIYGWFQDEVEIREEHWHPAAGEVVLDIGCHIGSYTIPALAAGATVYAIDPAVHYTTTLRGIAAAHNLTGGLVVVNEALSGPQGYTQEFRTALDAAPYPEHHAAAGASYTTLDELAGLLELTRLDLVKMDVEGAELSILQSGTETLRRFRPRLLIEDHTDVYAFVAAFDSTRRCTELLQGLDYEVSIARYPGHKTPPRTFMVGTPG
jgi:FkbM family methyltransferase